MGFATAKIVVRYGAFRFALPELFPLNKILKFWQLFYHESFLEFLYVNKKENVNIQLIFDEMIAQTAGSTASTTISSLNPESSELDDGRVLVPLGGTYLIFSMICLSRKYREGLL